jgi:hypothetical protein
MVRDTDLCSKHMCNSNINKFCEFSFLKWIDFLLTPIWSQFIRFQNAQHTWVMDRWTVNYKHKWLYLVICLWMISWAYKIFVPAINELNSIEEYKITQNVYWNCLFQILLYTQINLLEIIDVLHFCFFVWVLMIFLYELFNQFSGKSILIK